MNLFGNTLAFAVTAGGVASPAPEHFHPKGKPPSAYTVAAQQHQRAILPLSDQRDFAKAKRSLIALPPTGGS